MNAIIDHDTRSALRWTLGVAATVLAIKFAVFAADPHVRFFFGDSASYIHAALSDWVPPDRSPTYPFLIRFTAVATGWLPSLLLAQTIIGAGICLMVFSTLTRTLHVAPAISAVAVALLAVEPMQLFYERSVMAETAGTACFVAMLACACVYLRDRRWPWLIAVAALGIASVSFRMNLLPVVLVISALLPLALTFAQRPSRLGLRRWMAHLALAIVATACLHQAYKIANGSEHDLAPTYMAYEPLFRLGWLAPLVEPKHLVRQGLDPALLNGLPADIHDRRTREIQLWNERGLIPVLHKAGGDNGFRIAGKISQRILREQPLAVVRMGWDTFMDHLDADYARERLANDLGSTNVPPDGFVARIDEIFDHDASDWTHVEGLSYRAFAGSRWLITGAVFLIGPLSIVLVVLAWRRRDPALALLSFAGLGLVAAYILFSHILVFRYLHPLMPVLVMLLAVAVDRGRRSAGLNWRS